MGQPTIKDVAKLAGVSISTVSRVMNNSKPVSPEARRKVVDAINKLDFKPNELARSLVMRKSNLVGVIVKDIGIEYMAQLIRGIEEIGRVYKYDILLTSSYGDDKQVENSIDFLKTKQVEGLVIITEDISTEILMKLRETRVPFVILDKYHNYKNIKSVKVDYETEEFKLIESLTEYGHEDILLLAGKEENVINESMIRGYESAVGKDRSHILRINGMTSDDGYNCAEEAFNLIESSHISAVACVNDEIAIGFMNYCVDHGIKVPDDLSVVGFGDNRIASVYRPKLTTVSIPYYDIGAIAIRALIKRIKKEGDILDEDWIIDAQINKRESSKVIN
ncbi:LacI family DNA-binding transcriptional regulator [uncultured Anaerococcus sp.]|uniref:LacI family DNA-binding transcriptional regulator n=1 Tax=uncultured Anaerococcus sp. TaxID=293428 RepID=UPI0025ED11D5|nr:LacI family DNA-binding transcriptional regulator [uncultured Anaerococcus sp.]